MAVKIIEKSFRRGEFLRLARESMRKYPKIFKLLDAYDKSTETDIRKVTIPD